MPPFSPGFIFGLLVVGAAALILTGRLRLVLEDGRLAVQAGSRERPVVVFAYADSGLLLLLVLVLGWSASTAVDHSQWVDGTDRLVPLLSLALLGGWAMAITPLARAGYLGGSLAALVGGLLAFTPLPAGAPSPMGHPQALALWAWAVAVQPHRALLMGLLALMVVSGLWTAWWVFRRRHGLAALLPTGTILAVEILNDSNPILYFFTLTWLTCALLILVRINFVRLKDRWRARRLLRAADTGWNFGEVGFEATAILLVAAFVLPPLSSADISNLFVPGTVNVSQFHPFGIGLNHQGGPSQVGYSETVRPGSQLRAHPELVMVVTGDVPVYYPYLRGIALGGWDGLTWYPLQNGGDLTVAELPALASRASLPRDDLPGPDRLSFGQTTIRMVIPPQATSNTVFSAGEVIWVNRPTTVRGISTAASGSGATGGESKPPFDTVDRLRLTDNPQAPYEYTVREAVPNVDIASLRASSLDYPAWVQPYRQLYYQAREAQTKSNRDGDIAALARQIVDEAGASTPYDQAKAIEGWFQQKSRFHYTLTPPQAPAGQRPLDYFLFVSHRGFCQDFSTAMAVMLRTLGVPVRQMSGFGQGTVDDKTHQNLISSTDAHSWVEVYFAGYGWIPFEPTPDGANFPITRAKTAADLALPVPAGAFGGARHGPNSRLLAEPASPAATTASGGGGILGPIVSHAGWVALGLLLLLALGGLWVAGWLLTAHDLPRIWRRLLFLGDRLSVPRRASDTPLEYGARLGQVLPGLAPEVSDLANAWTRAGYRRGGLSASELATAQRRWRRIRREYPGLLAKSMRGRRGALSEAEVEVSGSRGPARLRGPRRRPHDG